MKSFAFAFSLFSSLCFADANCVITTGNSIKLWGSNVSTDAAYIAAGTICSNGGSVNCVLEVGNSIKLWGKNVSTDAAYVAAAATCKNGK